MSTTRNRALTLRSALAMAVVTALVETPAAHAIDFQNGELEGSFDTTVSYGATVRAQGRDPQLIGKATINPLIGRQNVTLGTSSFPGSPSQVAAPGSFSVNRDDGNRKYDEGDLVSSALKVTSELSLEWRGWGAFTRATWFRDFQNDDRQDLTRIARSRVGERFRILDGFVYGDFGYGQGKTATVRLGRQVVSWGESTFISNGINVINPVDLSALRVAGAELKEAFLPVQSLWASFQVTDNVSIEGVVLGEFEEIEADPSGTYFSSNDFASPGGTYVMLGTGTVPQPVDNPELFSRVCNGTAEGWAQSDRLGIHAAALRARLPAGTPDAVIDQQALALVGTGCAAAYQRGPNNHASDNGQRGVAVRWLVPELADTEFGFYYLRYHSRLPLISGYAASAAPATTPGTPGFGAPVRGASVIVEYPEGIDLYGLSWNTNLPLGVAFQGEVSYRPNLPVQYDDVELLLATLSPLTPPGSPVPPAARFVSQLGQFSAGQYVRGWGRFHASQVQSTFTKVFGEVLGADQITLVGEIGATRVNAPDRSRLRLEGEGTDTGGGCAVADVGTFGPPNPQTGSTPLIPGAGGLSMPGCLRNAQTLPGAGLPTDFSWGYRIAARAEFNSVWGGPVNLAPRIGINHDVQGTTPGPAGNFLEGRVSLTLGMEASYLNRWAFDISYTAFGGAQPYNQIADRDFASASVKYSF